MRGPAEPARTNIIMNKFIILLIFLLIPSISHAGGIIMQRQMMMQQRQRAYQQQLIQQRMIQQQVAYTRAVQQQLQQQFLAGRISQGQYQATLQALQQQFVQSAQGFGGGGVQISNTSDLARVYRELEITSEVWPQILDYEPKRTIFYQYVDIFRQNGVVISKPSEHYFPLIDSILRDRPALLRSPFREVLQFVAIIEYDFNNGVDPHQLALSVLGEEGYQSNLIRLGL